MVSTMSRSQMSWAKTWCFHVVVPAASMARRLLVSSLGPGRLAPAGKSGYPGEGQGFEVPQ